ncbi:hypothetical protein [Kaarinaea lacus]
MKQISYIKFALFLPLLVPLAITTPVWITCWKALNPNCINRMIDDWQLILGLYPLQFGAIPYLIFLFLTWRWITGDSNLPKATVLMLVPIIFAIWEFVITAVFYSFSSGFMETLAYAATLAFFSLLYGYAYVLIINSAWKLLEWIPFTQTQN